MTKRPTSVTVIAWVLLVSATVSLVTSALTVNKPIVRELMVKTPIPLPIQFVMLFGGLLISILCAIFMLRGANWARVLYIAWGALGVVTGFATSPAKLMLIPGFLIYVIFVFFLLRPGASAYFSGRDDVPT